MKCDSTGELQHNNEKIFEASIPHCILGGSVKETTYLERNIN